MQGAVLDGDVSEQNALHTLQPATAIWRMEGEAVSRIACVGEQRLYRTRQRRGAFQVTMPSAYREFRWTNYLMRRDADCRAFWTDYLSGGRRDILLILGLGFDPRMCVGLHMLTEAN